MVNRRLKPKEIISKLRQVEVLMRQGMSRLDSIRPIGVVEQTYYRWRKQYDGMGTVIGALSSNTAKGTANAQFAKPRFQSDDALWYLPNFDEQVWFLHVNNGRVLACNMDKVSVVSERAARRCSKGTVD